MSDDTYDDDFVDEIGAEGNRIEDEVGAEGNRIAGARALAVNARRSRRSADWLMPQIPCRLVVASRCYSPSKGTCNRFAMR